MEQHYKQALSEQQGGADSPRDLAQEVDRLSAHCQRSENNYKELLADFETIKREKDLLLSDHKSTQDQLSGTTEAFLKLQSETEALVNAQHQLDSLKSEIANLEQSLETSQSEMSKEKEAKASALEELSKVRAVMEGSVSADQIRDVSQLENENEALRSELAQAERQLQELSMSAHEIISPTHSTPQGHGNAPSIRAELYDGTQYADNSELSGDISKLREDLDALQTQYHQDTTTLQEKLEEERQNVESLRKEMHSSLSNSSAHQPADNLSELVTSLQSSNERLVAEKLELNKQLSEQERLCEKMHERLGASEALSSGVQESYSKQLAAAQKQRDEILKQLEEACRVNHQVQNYEMIS